jgi:hypothetical protein
MQASSERPPRTPAPGHETCPTCGGSGQVVDPYWMPAARLRAILVRAGARMGYPPHGPGGRQTTCLPIDVARRVLNLGRRSLCYLLAGGRLEDGAWVPMRVPARVAALAVELERRLLAGEQPLTLSRSEEARRAAMRERYETFRLAKMARDKAIAEARPHAPGWDDPPF